MRLNISFYARFKDVFEAEDLELYLPEGSTVGDMLEHLCDTENKRKAIYAQQGQTLRQDVLVTKNRQIVFYLKRLKTVLEDGDDIAIRYPACMG